MVKNGEYKIERGIPVPPAKGLGLTAALRKMKKGESVLLDRRPSSVFALAAQAGFKTGTFTTRSEGTAVRVWRVK